MTSSEMRMASLCIAAVTFAAITCGSEPPTQPTNSNLVAFSIRPALTSLKVFETVTFSVVGRFQDGTERIVDASWSTSAPSIVSIDSRGVAFAQGQGTTTISASTNGRVVSSALAVVPDLSGSWTGQMRIVTESRVSGAGPFRPFPGTVAPIGFVLTQLHDAVSGTGEMYLSPGFVTGTVTSDGGTTLAGRFSNAEGFNAEITAWSSHFDTSGNSTGHFTVQQRFTNIFGPQVIVDECEIVSLSHLP
jgi:hypothetical protein